MRRRGWTWDWEMRDIEACFGSVGLDVPGFEFRLEGLLDGTDADGAVAGSETGRDGGAV